MSEQKKKQLKRKIRKTLSCGNHVVADRNMTSGEWEVKVFSSRYAADRPETFGPYSMFCLSPKAENMNDLADLIEEIYYNTPKDKRGE